MPDHILDSNRSIFIRRVAVVVQSEAADRACIDYALDAFIEGSLHNVVRAFDIALVHFVWIFAPQTIVGGAVIDDAATFSRQPERTEIAKVSGDELNWKLLQVVTSAGRSNETSNLFAAFEENSNEMRSDESGAACDESFQDRVGIRVDQVSINCLTSS